MKGPDIPITLSLGSNVGDRAFHMKRACDLLENTDGIHIHQASRLLDNEALLFEDQPDFLNQILLGTTSLSPHELLRVCKSLEVRIGRIDRFRYGPREIDIDILTYGDLQIHDSVLTLPHPAIYERPYIRELLKDFHESPENLTRNLIDMVR